MKNFIFKIFGILSLLSVSFLGLSFAAEDISLLVTLEPNNFSVGESVDFTVTVMKDGEIFKDYTGDIIFQVIGVAHSNTKLSGGGIYSFQATDQGTKTFSKGLTIMEEGTFVFQVLDLMNDNINGEITVIVGDDTGTGENLEKIKITSPVSKTTEVKDSTMVIGSCTSLKNSPVVVYLNDKVVASGYSDSKGDFTIFADGLKSGGNELQVKIMDINDNILGESDVIFVDYSHIEDEFFKSLEIFSTDNKKITTSTIVQEGEKVIFNVETADTVNSVKLNFSNGSSFSMDRLSQGSFTKEITTNFHGIINISLDVVNGMEERSYDDIATIQIEQHTSISNIKFTETGVEGTSVIVSRDIIGDAEKYLVSFGTGKDDLSNNQTVTTSKILIENLSKDITYYFQITPLDTESHASGDPSAIVEYHAALQPCIVKGIKIRTEKIGDNYYLIWDPVENARHYEVYRSDWEDMTNSRKVGDLTGTKFQYLYDENASKEEYAYYQVQAICTDGSTVNLDKAQKVKVGPFENITLIIIISVFVYSIYRLYKISEE